MRKRAHLFIGLAVFLLCWYGIGALHSGAALPLWQGFVAVVIGSLFPDILEPATTRQHRGLFHSRGALKWTVVALAIATFLSVFPPVLPGIIWAYPAASFLLGYITHLLADSLSPAGLPR